MKLRGFGALVGAMLLTLSVAGAVFADSGSPMSVNAQVNGLTVTVSGDWTWESASCGQSSSKVVGWAVSWGDPAWTNNPVPKVGGGFYHMGDAVQGNQVFTTGELCKTFPGPWGPLSHTYAEAGSYNVCVIIYDLRDPAADKGNHSLLAGGVDRNTDNSVEENFVEGASVCLSPEFPLVIEGQPAISIVKTASPTTLPAGGGDVTYTYVVHNSGNVPIFHAKVRDDNGTTANAADDFDVTCPKAALAVDESMTCTALITGITATTTNVATATADWDSCNDECSTAVLPDSDDATVTIASGSAAPSIPAGGVENETDTPTAPPTDAIAPTPGDAGGSLPFLLIVLGVIGIGTIVLTPSRARR